MKEENDGMKLDNPHDKRFKELFGNKKRFLSLLRDCVREPWVNSIEEETLRKSEKSFILQDFSEKEADVVYEAKLNGEKVIFYILLELQSKVDYRMSYRLLLYVVEILRNYYNNADIRERLKKDFKFPVVFPIVFFTGSEQWTVPLQMKDIFSNADKFGEYVLDFKYMLLDAKNYTDDELGKFSSKLLGLILLLEKSKNSLEFYSRVRNHLKEITDFDEEERRILNMCIKILDLAYGYNKNEEIKVLIEKNNVSEVESMLCDVIENAKYEREQLLLEGELRGRLEGKIETARNMLQNMLPIDLIMKCTNLSQEQIENIRV